MSRAEWGSGAPSQVAVAKSFTKQMSILCAGYWQEPVPTGTCLCRDSDTKQHSQYTWQLVTGLQSRTLGMRYQARWVSQESLTAWVQARRAANQEEGSRWDEQQVQKQPWWACA